VIVTFFVAILLAILPSESGAGHDEAVRLMDARQNFVSESDRLEKAWSIIGRSRTSPSRTFALQRAGLSIDRSRATPLNPPGTSLRERPAQVRPRRTYPRSGSALHLVKEAAEGEGAGSGRLFRAPLDQGICWRPP
jgi:hypothetical protein